MLPWIVREHDVNRRAVGVEDSAAAVVAWNDESIAGPRAPERRGTGNGEVTT
jgi:hypothetical protein